jgi:hypothetical protein
MNRLEDLKEALPSVIMAAIMSPPVEILVLNYNSQDGLRDWMDAVSMRGPVTIRSVRYTGRDHYHMAHARNLSVINSVGQVTVVSCADIMVDPTFFQVIRRGFEDGLEAMFATGNHYPGVTAVLKKEFMDAGGFDERFEYYGPEDKDLIERLKRRGVPYGHYDELLLNQIKTPRLKKTEHYRTKSLYQMWKMMQPIFKENKANGVLVANPDGWGRWT